jgi:chromosome segregation ATPase
MADEVSDLREKNKDLKDEVASLKKKVKKLKETNEELETELEATKRKLNDEKRNKEAAEDSRRKQEQEVCINTQGCLFTDSLMKQKINKKQMYEGLLSLNNR